MRHFRSIAITAVTGCISFVLLPNIHADTWNKKTVLTVNEPIQVPSCCTPDHTVMLQPGEYIIMLVDSLSDRHIVRIFDKDQKEVITTILAIPNYRLKPTGKSVFQFWEVPAGQPKALRAWFYPGDNFGQEFAYPKQTAAMIATLVKAAVPAIEVNTTVVEDLKTATVVVVDETGSAREIVKTAAEPELVAQAAPRVEPVQAAAPTPVEAPQQTLPDTASFMPLFGLIGILSLGTFTALGVRSRRHSKR